MKHVGGDATTSIDLRQANPMPVVGQNLGNVVEQTDSIVCHHFDRWYDALNRGDRSRRRAHDVPVTVGVSALLQRSFEVSSTKQHLKRFPQGPE